MAATTKRFYVVFHGLFAFFQRKQDQLIEVYLPDLREKRTNAAGGVETHSPHVYRAGNWLSEITIAPGADLTLEGVEKGPARFDRFRNVIVEGPNKRSAVEPYAKLTFPQPAEVIALREIEVELGVDIIGKSAGRIKGSKLVTIPVFRYELGDEARLCLGCHPWVPAATGDTVTLHVFAEPEVPQGSEHSHHEFGKAFELFEDVDLRLARALKLPEIGPDVKLPPGLLREELEDLLPRTRRLATLGRLFKSGGNLRDAWDQAEAYGENPTACTGGGLDDSLQP